MLEQVQENRIPKFRKKSIFVVADLRQCFSLVGLILSKTPYDAFFATERYQAVDMLAVGFKPHLFLFDYHLPGMNGMELYDLLHEREELAAIPTIILSYDYAQHRHEISKRGLTCVTKPVSADELLCCIEQFLTASQSLQEAVA